MKGTIPMQGTIKMLPTSLITDKCRQSARAKRLPVEVVNDYTYSVPSATGGAAHRPMFDNVSQPTHFRCTCKAYQHGQACHAVAAALEKHIERALRRSLEASPVEVFAAPIADAYSHLSACEDHLMRIANLTTASDELDIAATARVNKLTHYARLEVQAAQVRIINGLWSVSAPVHVAAWEARAA